MASWSLLRTLQLLALLQLSAAVWGGAGGGAELAVLTTQLRRLLVQLEQQRRPPAELAARLARLETAVALHHRHTGRRLDAMTAHLATLERAVADRRPEALLARLAEDSRACRQLADGSLRSSSTQLQQLASTVRRQSRALVAFRALLPPAQLASAVLKNGDQLLQVRDDISRLHNASADEGHRLQEKIDSVQRLVTLNVATTKKLDQSVPKNAAQLQKVFNETRTQVDDLKTHLLNHTLTQGVVTEQIMSRLKANDDLLRDQHEKLDFISYTTQQVLDNAVTNGVMLDALHNVSESKSVCAACEESLKEVGAVRQDLGLGLDTISGQMETANGRLTEVGVSLIDNKQTLLDARNESMSQLITITNSQKSLKQSVHKLEAVLNTLENGQSAVSNSISGVQDALKSLVSGQNTLNKTSSTSQQILRNLLHGQNAVNSSLSAMLQTLQSCENERSTMNSSISGMQETLKSLLDGQNALNSSFRGAQQTLMILASGQKILENSLSAVHGRLSDFDVIRNSTNSYFEGLEKNLTTLGNGQDSLNNSMEVMQELLRKVAVGQNTLSGIFDELHAKMKSLEDVQNGSNSVLGTLKAALDGQADKQNLLHGFLKKMQTDIENLKSGQNSVSASVKDLKTEFNETLSENGTLEAAVGELKLSIHQVNGAIINGSKNWTAVLSRVQKELVGLSQQFQVLKLSFTKLKDQRQVTAEPPGSSSEKPGDAPSSTEKPTAGAVTTAAELPTTARPEAEISSTELPAAGKEASASPASEDPEEASEIPTSVPPLTVPATSVHTDPTTHFTTSVPPPSSISTTSTTTAAATSATTPPVVVTTTTKPVEKPLSFLDAFLLSIKQRQQRKKLEKLGK